MNWRVTTLDGKQSKEMVKAAALLNLVGPVSSRPHFFWLLIASYCDFLLVQRALRAARSTAVPRR